MTFSLFPLCSISFINFTSSSYLNIFTPLECLLSPSRFFYPLYFHMIYFPTREVLLSSFPSNVIIILSASLILSSSSSSSSWLYNFHPSSPSTVPLRMTLNVAWSRHWANARFSLDSLMNFTQMFAAFILLGMLQSAAQYFVYPAPVSHARSWV